MAAPQEVRATLESKVGSQLPENFSFGDAMVLINLLAATGVNVGGMPQLAYSREIREAVEGKKIEISEPEGGRDREAIRGSIMGKLLDMMVDRAKTYGMEIPQLQELAKEADLKERSAVEERE